MKKTYVIEMDETLAKLLKNAGQIAILEEGVSGNTQKGLSADNASESFFCVSEKEADEKVKELKESGKYRKIDKRKYNNGSKKSPRWEYKINVWKK